MLIGIPLAAYLLVGGANVSVYRGAIDASTIRFILSHVLVMLAVAGGLAGVGAGRRPARDGKSVDSTVLALVFLPGVIGFALTVSRVGFGALNPAARFNANGLTLLLLETTTAAVALYCYRVFAIRPFRPIDGLVICGGMVMVGASGYRGWVIVTLVLPVFIAHYLGRHRLTIRRAAMFMLIGIAIFGGFSAIRRSEGSTTGLLTSAEAARKYNAERIPAGLREFITAFASQSRCRRR